MKPTALLQAGVLALTCSFLAINASAAVISVNNASFEILPLGGLPNLCGAGCSYSSGTIPDWDSTGGDFGQFQPGTPANFSYFDTLSDGPTSAYSNGPTISQTVLPSAVEGLTYTLLVDVGDRKDADPAGTIALLIGGTQHLGIGVPVDGAFSTYTVTYLATALDAGQSITIQLLSSGAQGNFDNVRLSDDVGVGGTGTVPEPGTMAMLGFGLAAVGVLRRKLA